MIKWDRAPTELDFDGYLRRLRQEAYAAGDAIAAMAQAEMRQNHPWKNDTGAAEAGLVGVCVKELDRIAILFGHTVPYGPPLEYARGGRLAIIGPTLDKLLPVARRIFTGLVVK